jgi:hypothetical protein
MSWSNLDAASWQGAEEPIAGRVGVLAHDEVLEASTDLGAGEGFVVVAVHHVEGVVGLLRGAADGGDEQGFVFVTGQGTVVVGVVGVVGVEEGVGGSRPGRCPPQSERW